MLPLCSGGFAIRPHVHVESYIKHGEVKTSDMPMDCKSINNGA